MVVKGLKFSDAFSQTLSGKRFGKQAIGQESDTVVDRILTGLSFKF